MVSCPPPIPPKPYDLLHAMAYPSISTGVRSLPRLDITPNRPHAASVPLSPLFPSANKNTAQCNSTTKAGKQCSRKHRDAMYAAQTGFYDRQKGKEDTFVESSNYIPQYLQRDTQLAFRVEMEKSASPADVPGWYIYTYEIRGSYPPPIPPKPYDLLHAMAYPFISTGVRSPLRLDITPNRPRAASVPLSPLFSSANKNTAQCNSTTKAGKQCSRQQHRDPVYANTETDVRLESITPPEAISSVAEILESSWKAAEFETKPEISEVVKVRCRGTNSKGDPCGNWVYPSDRYCDFHCDQDTGIPPVNVNDTQCQPTDTAEDPTAELNILRHTVINPKPEEGPSIVIEETQENRVQCKGYNTTRKRRQCLNRVFPADGYCIKHRDQDTRSRVSSAKVEGPQQQTTHTFCLSSEPSSHPPSHPSQRPRLSWARRVWNALIPPPHQPLAHDYISLNSSQHAPT